MKPPGGRSPQYLTLCDFCGLSIRDVKRIYVNTSANEFLIVHRKKCDRWMRWVSKRYHRYSWFLKRKMDENFRDAKLIAGEYKWSEWG